MYLEWEEPGVEGLTAQSQCHLSSLKAEHKLKPPLEERMTVLGNAEVLESENRVLFPA
jgi:hypothetical protein